MSKNPSKIYVIDTETTGTDPYRHAIIEATFIEVATGNAMGDYSLSEPVTLRFPFVKGREVVDPIAMRINGYDHRRLVYGSGIETFIDTYIDSGLVFENAMFIGANVMFDVNFLDAFFWNNGKMFERPTFFYKHLDLQAAFTGMKNAYGNLLTSEIAPPPLSTMLKHYGIENPDAHTSLGDCEATANLFLRMFGNS